MKYFISHFIHSFKIISNKKISLYKNYIYNFNYLNFTPKIFVALVSISLCFSFTSS